MNRCAGSIGNAKRGAAYLCLLFYSLESRSVRRIVDLYFPPYFHSLATMASVGIVASKYRFSLGIAVMAIKMRSYPMKTILNWLTKSGMFGISEFKEDMILELPPEQWPRVDCLICFYSPGFPLEKAIAYVELFQPIVLNSVVHQRILRNRANIYTVLDAFSIPHPNYIVVDHDAINAGFGHFEEHYDYIVCGNKRLNKPFVEKPIDADDHNNWIYYAKNTGGGCKRLFRKMNDRSSEHFPNSHTVRRNGVYVYEEFLSTFGTDVKVYTVGRMFAHAEARKAPSLDGKVERTKDGKEKRMPVMLSEEEKLIVGNLIDAFDQNVCGFDILRHSNGAFVCDVNGWSFVKGNPKYCNDAANVIRALFWEKLRERYEFLPHETLRPIAMTDDELMHRTFADFKEDVALTDHEDEEVKLKSPEELQDLLERNSQILIKLEAERATASTSAFSSCHYVDELTKSDRILDLSPIENHQWLQHVLLQGDGFMGINRKIQLKPISWEEKGVDEDGRLLYSVSRCMVVAKWAGQITYIGELQAEDLGKHCRASLYPGDSTGLLRLHSTFRHDFKIYSSDEGRCQITSAAFTKGFLDLEGELTPILVSLKCKVIIENLLNQDADLVEICKNAVEFPHLQTVIHSKAFLEVISKIGNPFKRLQKINKAIEEFVEAITSDLIQWESLDENSQRSGSKERYDTSQVPDVSDNIRYDLIHHHIQLGNALDKALDISTLVEPLTNFVAPGEYGLSPEGKLKIGTHLLQAVKINRIQCSTLSSRETTHKTEESFLFHPSTTAEALPSTVSTVSPPPIGIATTCIEGVEEVKQLPLTSKIIPLPTSEPPHPVIPPGGKISFGPCSPSGVSARTNTTETEILMNDFNLSQGGESPTCSDATSGKIIPLSAFKATSSPNFSTFGNRPKRDKNERTVINTSVLWAHQTDFRKEKNREKEDQKQTKSDVLSHHSKSEDDVIQLPFRHKNSCIEQKDCEEEEEFHEHEAEEQYPIRLEEENARALGIRSPWRIVRSRYYVTSASHLQSLMNILSSAHEVNPPIVESPLLGADAHEELQKVKDPHYLSHIVMRVWENKKMDKDSAKRYRLEMQFCSGAEDGYMKQPNLLKKQAAATFHQFHQDRCFSPMPFPPSSERFPSPLLIPDPPPSQGPLLEIPFPTTYSSYDRSLSEYSPCPQSSTLPLSPPSASLKIGGISPEKSGRFHSP
ncbi:histidine acid phosphatase superfamily protein, partial [Cardiosporidium cionae]